MKKILVVSAVCLLFNFVSVISFASDNGNIGTAGKSYAGYGYTHGYIPVNEDVEGTSIFDSDIMRYDVNNSKPADFYFNQNDLKQNYADENNLIQHYSR
ncbi:hypothetical protein IJ541_08470 [bacterium]|nr:hypothetical protein [bacterium]